MVLKLAFSSNFFYFAIVVSQSTFSIGVDIFLMKFDFNIGVEDSLLYFYLQSSLQLSIVVA